MIAGGALLAAATVDAIARRSHMAAGRVASSSRTRPTQPRGDEFGIVPDGFMDARSAETVGAKLCQTTAGAFVVEGHEVAVRLRVGGAISTSGQLDASALLSRADRAMYEAKRSGTGVRVLEVSAGQP